jgi:hypothetical protein
LQKYWTHPTGLESEIEINDEVFDLNSCTEIKTFVVN